jgi:hypothetical protein
MNRYKIECIVHENLPFCDLPPFIVTLGDGQNSCFSPRRSLLRNLCRATPGSDAPAQPLSCSSNPTISPVDAIDDSKCDTIEEIVQRRSPLSQHSCIMAQTPSVRPRSGPTWGRSGLAPEITCRITPSSRYPSNGNSPENA